jgi:hypothetical protein
MSDYYASASASTDWRHPETTTEGRVEMNTKEIIRQLNAELGPTLVAAAAGSRDPDASREWSASTGSFPRPEMVRRLRFVYAAWVAVAAAEGQDAARIWFVALNPRLGGDSPIDAIREDRFRQTKMAVDVFIQDGFAG